MLLPDFITMYSGYSDPTCNVVVRTSEQNFNLFKNVLKCSKVRRDAPPKNFTS